MARALRAPRRLAVFSLGFALALVTLGPTRVSLAAARGRAARGSAKAGGRPAGGRLDGKVAIFPLKYDDDRTIYVQLERILRSKGLEVVSGVRPVDTAEQYRELAMAMGLAAFVGGDYWEKEDKARVTIQIRSGYTGRKVAVGTFKETPLHMHNEIEEKLWTKVGSSLARACVDANKPRKKGRNPLMIEAGTPLEASTAPPARARSTATAQARPAPTTQGRAAPPIKVAVEPEL
jgi:hypothetical protein